MLLIKKNLRTIIPLLVVAILIMFMVLYFNLKPRLVYTYSDYYDGYLVSESYGNSKSYTVKAEFNGKPVVGIGVRAFYQNSNLEEIIFEDKLEVIERLAFSECHNLKTVDLSHVRQIERNAFSYCESLDNIVIGSRNIAGSAFYKCEGLKSVTLNEGLRTIGTYAFSYTSMKSLRLPTSMTEVYDDAFKYQTTLEELEYYYSFNNNYVKSLPYAKSYS